MKTWMWFALGAVVVVVGVVIYRAYAQKQSGGGLCCEIPDGEGGVVQIRCTNCNSGPCKDACGAARTGPQEQQKEIVVVRPVQVVTRPVGRPVGVPVGAGSVG